MKVLVATQMTQGMFDDDVFTCHEGELVAIDHCPDCSTDGTVFRGIASKGVTTMALLVDRPEITRAELVEIVNDDWIDHLGMHQLTQPGNEDLFDLVRQHSDEEVQAIEDVFRWSQVGLVVRRSYDKFLVKDSRELDGDNAS